MRRLSTFLVVVSLALLPALAGAGTVSASFSPGASGAGDPYFPLAGNGGYDTTHYLLKVSYDPASDVLTGVATIEATATQNLSAFNFDFEGLTIRSLTVNGVASAFSRTGGELTVTPAAGISQGTRFTTIVHYDGIPETLPDGSGFVHTDDGALVVGEPFVAATWYPVNDHPIDKAAYTFEISVPAGTEAISNGILLRQRHSQGQTTWVWDAREPMASYLAMMAIGEFDVSAYRSGRIRFWDALDPDLFDQPSPVSGEQFAYSQQADASYKRLLHVISVPADGANLSFQIDRDTEQDWDYVFVEAHIAGTDDWTTLPDLNGNTAQETGNSCEVWPTLHPFLAHYQIDCAPTGTSGVWWAASGSSEEYEQWSVDLTPFAGNDVEVAISYVSDGSVQGVGVVVDDVVVSTGTGTTSFENDGDTFDGWTVPGPPEGSPPNEDDWIAATVAELPPSPGEVAESSFARQPEVIAFEASIFGPYPFSAAGGVVDDIDVGFALENQTRPIYSAGFFGNQLDADSVVVHEIAHQWYGDSLAVAAWQHIWLNEGFATYAEWLWSEREGLGTVDEIFRFFFTAIPRDDPFWSITIGDPGPENLFDFSVYIRGAMTLHILRQTIGDDVFFDLLRSWATLHAGGNVTTDQFIALAESLSGQQLDGLFQTWLFTGVKPSRPLQPDTIAEGGRLPAVVAAQVQRLDEKEVLRGHLND